MSAQHDHWNTVYRTKAANTVSWYEASPRLSLDLVARAELDPDTPIIDIGGGLSELPEALIAAGHRDVTVLDISEAAVATHVARGVGAHGIVADITEWTPERRYGLWHDRAMLHFLTDEADRDAYRRALLAALAPDGQAIIATFAPSGPERCSGLPVRRYGRADIEAFLGGDFDILESFEFEHLTPAGAVQRFHVARLKRL